MCAAKGLDGMDEDLMCKWLIEIWTKHTKLLPSLLVLDSFKGHITDLLYERYKELSTTVSVIPGGCTSVLQPLDVAINKPFKSVLRM